MRVGSDHDAARPDEPLLHHQLVADAFLEDMGDAELVGKVSDDLVQARRRHGVRRQDVIKNHDDAFRVPERDVELAKGFDRQRTGDVVRHRVIDRRDHDLAGVDLPSEPSCEDLFSQCSHCFLLSRD